MTHTPGRSTVGGLGPIARIGMPEGLSRGFRKSTQAFGAAGGLRPSEGIARLGGVLKTVLQATQLQCRDRGARMATSGTWDKCQPEALRSES